MPSALRSEDVAKLVAELAVALFYAQAGKAYLAKQVADQRAQ